MKENLEALPHVNQSKCNKLPSKSEIKETQSVVQEKTFLNSIKFDITCLFNNVWTMIFFKNRNLKGLLHVM